MLLAPARALAQSHRIQGGEPLPTATYMGFQIGPSRRARNGCRGNGRIRGTTLFFRVSREEEYDSFKGVQRKRKREREGHWPPNRRLASAFLACHRRPTTSRQDLREEHRLVDASRDYVSL